ncbi:MAG: AbrB/MazE/SpoVT family DNA-binding domain-containing protein [Phycisphaerae bacterium]|nr:AbrB/MazE/SpoVT family DNA-binding domain-containing protein [Phycisphaerae bacterium]
METTIDKFGRVVIPKKFRDSLGLGPGTKLDIEEDEGAIRLVTQKNGVGLVRRNGRLVCTGKLLEEVRDPVKEARDARIRDIVSRSMP